MELVPLLPYSKCRLIRLEYAHGLSGSCWHSKISAESWAVFSGRRSVLPQVVDLCVALGGNKAHLLLFSARPKVSWKSKIWHRDIVHEDVT